MSSSFKKLAARLALAFGALAIVAPAAMAQSFPSRPLKMIVPWPPGGPTDIVARLVAIKMSEELGQPVVVDNRAGATGMLGSSVVSSAPPDGYLFVMGTIGSHVQAPLMAGKVPYNARTGFTPISLLVMAPMMLMVNPQLKADTVSELVALMMASPDKFTYSSTGIGSPAHLASKMLEHMTGARGLHVPYKGSAPALQAVVAGEVDFLFDVVSSAQPFVSSGRTRGLAVAGAKRVGSMSTLPTMMEVGFPKFEAYTWNALFAPPGTPADIVARLNKASVNAVKDPHVVARLVELGLEPVGSTPAELAALLSADIAKWGLVIAASGLKGSN